MRHYLHGSLLLVLLFGIVGCRSESDLSTRVRRQVQAHQGPYATSLRRFYDARSNAPAWVEAGGPTPQGRALLRRLCQADREYLDPSAYGLDSLVQGLRDTYLSPTTRSTSDHARQVASLEMALSEAALRYADDLVNGRIHPEEVGGQWNIERETQDPAAVLQQALEGELAAVFDTLAARHHRYTPLREALLRYRELAAQGGWPSVPADGPLRPGSTGERVARLRQRLAATGDLQKAATGDDSSSYDTTLARAVRHFERSHNLPSDGIVSARDFEALNVSAQTRARQLGINMERLRWLPEDFGDEYIFVNLTDFQVTAHRNGTRALSMPIVVGRA